MAATDNLAPADNPSPDQSTEPSLLDSIAYFCRIEAEEKDRQLRADLMAAGYKIPLRDEDEED